MTDFGHRKQVPDASAANQELLIAAAEAVEDTILAQTAQANIKPVDAEVFDDEQSTYTSAEMDVSDYRDFMLRMILAVTGTPTDITIDVLVSYSGATYEKYMSGPFGSLMYEDSAGAKAEAVSGKIIAPKMKIRATATGTDADNTFTLTCKVAVSR